MRKTIRKIGELQSLDTSPITPKGQVVFSTIHEESDPNNPRDRYVIELTPGGEDAIKVLEFLDNMNGIGWTLELKRIEKELRVALQDLMGAKP